MSKFINGDCLKYMREYPDNHFDLAIVDPPYGDGGGEWLRSDKKRFGGIFDKYRGYCKQSETGGGITNGTPAEVSRTGGTWAAKYGKKS